MLDGLGLLPAVAYQPPQVGRPSSNVSRNKKQLHFAQLPSSAYSSDADEDDDDFPTPRGMPQSASAASDAASWRESCSSFNSLYDVSDNDSEIVPLKLSNSIKKAVNKPVTKHNRLPSLVIPSPTAWPTIQKLKAKATITPAATMSSVKTPLSPQALARLSIHNSLQVPGANATPSLDGSLTSDDVATMSSCTTPASFRADDADGQWDMPIQLDPQVMDTLLAFDASETESVVEVGVQQTGEMQSQGRSITDVIFATQHSQDNVPASAIEPFSAISLPSPGGFFSSLDSPSKRVWAAAGPQTEEAPNTSTAENFYGVPWTGDGPDRYIDLCSPYTARKDSDASDLTTVDEMVIPAHRQYDYDEQYEDELHRKATTNMSRTSLWLNQQDTYLAVLKAPPTASHDSTYVESPMGHTSIKSPISITSPRKSVRFVAEPQPKTPQTATRVPLSATADKQKADPLFYHAFQHLLATNSVETAYTHRHVRANALSTQRRYVADKHRRQLACAYSLPSGTSVASARDFSHLNSGPAATAEDASARAAIQAADRERQALDQLSLSIWALLATRYLASTSTHSLLSPPAAAILAANPAAKVLDLGGQPTADWAWALALEHRDAKIHTVLLDAQPDTSNWKAHRGPRNHRVHESPCAWTLPFADATFDIVSARTLHTLLRDNHGFDEWAATLAEIRRVLVPGGVFCYEALDAELSPLNNTANASAPPAAVTAGTNAPGIGAALAARSAEFAVAVRQLGYSASAGMLMPQRLARAGFSTTELAAGKRAWVSLPLASATDEAGVEAITSLAGSVAWERWMLKLQREMGRPEERLLDGVGKALDEAGSSGGWRVLRGWVRKE